jgi:Fe2+ or Zn2+ uptake regulation protein
MEGWREVCDECSTTLFNYHYMCKQCGYMACIECSNQFSQLTIEKRKSKFFNLKKKKIKYMSAAYELHELVPIV